MLKKKKICPKISYTDNELWNLRSVRLSHDYQQPEFTFRQMSGKDDDDDYTIEMSLVS